MCLCESIRGEKREIKKLDVQQKYKKCLLKHCNKKTILVCSFENISRSCSLSASQRAQASKSEIYPTASTYDLILQVSGKPEYSLAERTVSSFIHAGKLLLR